MHGSVGSFRPDVRLLTSTRKLAFTIVARTMLVGLTELAMPSPHPGHFADQSGPHDERVREASVSSHICRTSSMRGHPDYGHGRSALALLVTTLLQRRPAAYKKYGPMHRAH